MRRWYWAARQGLGVGCWASPPLLPSSTSTSSSSSSSSRSTSIAYPAYTERSFRVNIIRYSGSRTRTIQPPRTVNPATHLQMAAAAVATFALSVLKIAKGDITRWSVDSSSDAIVNPANERMLGGGGADGAIHRAAGPELVEACRQVPEVRPGVRCPTGEARITPGFHLPASHVIHTVGPVYHSDPDPPASLSSAYRSSLALAKEHNIRYIAFPAISCGVFAYPYEDAAQVAISTVKEFADGLKEVHFVLFSDELYDIWLKKAKELLQT